MTDESREQRWEALRDESRQRFGKDSIFGEGSLDARVVILGEAPGANEISQSRPFVGRAGQLLDELLQAAGIDREQVYVTNAVKLRPTKEQDGRLSNRPPRAAEVREGTELLLRELQLVEPELLIPLGNTPAKALIGKSFAMGKHRGTTYRSILGPPLGIPALATYHPAYLLRQQGEDFRRVRELVIDDLSSANRSLEHPPEPRELEE